MGAGFLVVTVLDIVHNEKDIAICKNTRNLPIGIQDFEKLRKNDLVYVDKTAFVYKLAHTNCPYFLSRPRRFGKSLFLSTLRYYWEGRKELFEGLQIAALEKDNPDAWKAYPVFYFDLNRKNFQRETALEEVLADHLRDWESLYGNEYAHLPIEERFQHLLVKAYEQTGLGCFVLVDEYDKPLLDSMDIPGIVAHNKAVFKGFFSTLKSYDKYLRFAFFTGVTKFSKVSIFSDLNQLNDITLDYNYDSICGITQTELEENFAPEIEAMAERFRFSKDECLAELKRMYDGYHFCMNCPDIYNPFSLINAFSKKDLGSYWFSTGTPTFLIKKLDSISFDPRRFDALIKIEESEITDYRPENPDPVPLLYQSGYLTIKTWNERQRSYKLGFPNDEVKYGFLKSLAPSYLKIENHPAPFNISILDDAVEEGDTDGMRDWFKALFSLLPYPTSGDLEAVTEQSFQNVIYISLVVLGKYCRTEVHSSHGRADCIVETPDYVYLFEFKRDGSAQDALAQIEQNGYATPYAADKRTLLRIGVNFSSAERNITEWEVM